MQIVETTGLIAEAAWEFGTEQQKELSITIKIECYKKNSRASVLVNLSTKEIDIPYIIKITFGVLPRK